MEALNKGPLSAVIEVNKHILFYKSGVYNTYGPCGLFLNHAITLVGYDLTDEIPNFTIKNSW